MTSKSGKKEDKIIEKDKTSEELLIENEKLRHNIEIATRWMRNRVERSVHDISKRKIAKMTEVGREEFLRENHQLALEKRELEENKAVLVQLESTLKNVGESVTMDNLESIKFINKSIYNKVIDFSDHFHLSDKKSNNIEEFVMWSDKIKDGMRLINIVSLNDYIYHCKGEQGVQKIEQQFELVKYFDRHLEKEWLLKTRRNYANRLFYFLWAESFVLVGLIIWAVLSQDKDFIELIKVFASVGLLQITGMVVVIVKYLFEKNGDVEKVTN